MSREIIRVEPYSTYLERFKAPTSAVSRGGGLVFVSGMPPFDPQTGDIVDGPIERETELVLDQMKACLEAAGLIPEFKKLRTNSTMLIPSWFHSRPFRVR